MEQDSFFQRPIKNRSLPWKYYRTWKKQQRNHQLLIGISAINLAIDSSINVESNTNVYVNTEDISGVSDNSQISLLRELKYATKYQEGSKMSLMQFQRGFSESSLVVLASFMKESFKVLWCLLCSLAADNLPLNHKYTDASSFEGFVLHFQMQVCCEENY